MPANKNAMTRYKILDELLSNRYHNYSLDDLTEEVNKRLAEMYPDTDGVGRRTIEKDIEYLEYEGPFLADIERYSAASYDTERQRTYTKRCLRYANPSFSIFKKDLSSDEENLLVEVFKLLGQFEGLPNFDGLESLRLGLGVNNANSRIISFTKNPLEKSSLLGELFTSISQKQVIELHYHTFREPNKDSRVVIFPYILKEYNSRWFVIGAAEEDNAMLTFALDRISKVEALPSHKYREYEGEINEWFEDIIGVTNLKDSPVYEICFWVSDVSKDYVMTKPIHESQRTISESDTMALRKKYPTLKGGRFFRIDCKYNYELIRELTSFGKELMVLEPSYICNKVRERVEEMFSEYEKLRT